MTIIYTEGVYHVNAESTDSKELIKEMALAIHQLSQENDSGDYESSPLNSTGEGAELN